MMEYAYRTLIGELSLENNKLKSRVAELEHKLSTPVFVQTNRQLHNTIIYKQKEAA